MGSDLLTRISHRLDGKVPIEIVVGTMAEAVKSVVSTVLSTLFNRL